jgi:branched-chain amino acid transport system ATP-binding protein
MTAAITIIKDEHRALAAVLHGLLYLNEQTRKDGRQPDFPLLKSMLDYLVAFPDRLHHPKEDEYVYRLLRDREPAAAATLDELQDDHRRGPEQTRALIDALEAYRRDATAFEAFARVTSTYADSQWAHMRKEEDVILPIAQKALLPADWIEIDAAFRSNADPLVGVDTQREFRELFRRVVNLMPAPMGLGPEQP